MIKPEIIALHRRITRARKAGHTQEWEEAEAELETLERLCDHTPRTSPSRWMPVREDGKGLRKDGVPRYQAGSRLQMCEHCSITLYYEFPPNYIRFKMPTPASTFWERLG